MKSPGEFKQKGRGGRALFAERNKSRKDPGLASLFAGDFSGMIPEPTGTTAIATNAGYAKLFAELGLGSLAVGIALVVLIPFLRKLITDKAETPPAETPATACRAVA
jgi:dipeptide/tripeptide permease